MFVLVAAAGREQDGLGTLQVWGIVFIVIGESTRGARRDTRLTRTLQCCHLYVRVGGIIVTPPACVIFAALHST